jgi:micrococcal nuclease
MMRRRSDIYPPLWRRRPVVTIVLLVCAGLMVAARMGGGPASSPRTANAADDRQRYDRREATVVRVVDGDTLDVDIPDGGRAATRIRLWGVDTPEVAGSPRGAMAFGTEASTYTRNEVEGRRVRIALEPERASRDKYGRLLAYVYRLDTGEMLNERLLESGHAYADVRFDHVYKRRFAALEGRASKARAGLWAVVTPEQYPPWRQRYEAWRASGTTTQPASGR